VQINESQPLFCVKFITMPQGMPFAPSARCPRHSESPSTDTHNFADLLAESAEDLQTPQGINNSLAHIFRLLAGGHISTRRATGLAYISSLLLRTLPAIANGIGPREIGLDNPPNPRRPPDQKTTTRRTSRPATTLANNLPCMPPQRSRYLKLHMQLCLKVRNFIPVAFPARAAPRHEHHQTGNPALTQLHQAPYTALMPPPFSARRSNFDWRGFITPGVKLIVIICSGVFLVQTLADLLLGGGRAFHLIVQTFGLIPDAVIHGLRIWQPATYIFLHGGLFHLLINMLMLWMFGRELEQVWGKRRFLNYFFLCGVGAGLIEVVIKTIPTLFGKEASLVPTIGASGAIFGILIANAILFPDRRIWLIPLPVTIPMRPYVAVMAAIEFFGTLSSGGDNVSHLCHLGGMLVGWIYLRRGSFLYNVRNSVTDWKVQRNKKKFQVYMNKHKDPPSRPDNWVN
jgi:membrane associated rhomboid family serine protease